jgi:hypothetical protein
MLRHHAQNVQQARGLNSPAREFMSSGAPWVRYVNEVVLGQLRQAGIAIDEDYKISTAGKSARHLIELFKDDGWSWPQARYRRNRNRAHRRGIHLEKEIEAGKWLHLIIVPQEHLQTRLPNSRLNLESPPVRLDLHAENLWLQPSSVAHFRDFIRERYVAPWISLFGLLAQPAKRASA